MACPALSRSTQPDMQLCAAAYTGLKLDIDRIRLDNESKTDVQRKAGLIIWSGRK